MANETRTLCLKLLQSCKKVAEAVQEKSYPNLVAAAKDATQELFKFEYCMATLKSDFFTKQKLDDLAKRLRPATLDLIAKGKSVLQNPNKTFLQPEVDAAFSSYITLIKIINETIPSEEEEKKRLLEIKKEEEERVKWEQQEEEQRKLEQKKRLDLRRQEVELKAKQEQENVDKQLLAELAKLDAKEGKTVEIVKKFEESRILEEQENAKNLYKEKFQALIAQADIVTESKDFDLPSEESDDMLKGDPAEINALRKKAQEERQKKKEN